MSLFQNNPLLAAGLAQMHGTCFERGWLEKEFTELLALPGSLLWGDDRGFLLCLRCVDELEVLTICVLPDKRRQGAASSYLNDMKAYALSEKIKKIFLEVSEKNEAARQLYGSFGFVQIARRARYYQTKDGYADALCLELNL